MAEGNSIVWSRRLGCLFDSSPPEVYQARLSSFKIKSTRVSTPLALPTHVDLRSGFSPITTQLYNSCTAEALVAAYCYGVIAQGGRVNCTEMSRMFLYFQGRLIEGTTQQDDGAQIYSGVLTLLTSGLAEEMYWPNSSGIASRPPQIAYTNAIEHKAVNAALIDQTLESLRSTLAAGRPIVSGFLVFPSIQTVSVEKTGGILTPSEMERKQTQPLGGHAVVLVGYDDPTERFIFRNSWGTSWGEEGYGYLPYAYVVDPFLCRDNWVLLSVQDQGIAAVIMPSVKACCTTCEPKTCCCARTRIQSLPPEKTPSQRRRELLKELSDLCD